MITQGSVKGIAEVRAVGYIECVPCIKAKSQALPSTGTRPRATSFLENVHVNLSGIIRTPSINDIMYFILFRDDYSFTR